MPFVNAKDGVEIFYKDWGKGQPIVFSHGWPLSADDWDAQMMFFLNHGYRVVAHDRRGHGRSTQVADGHDMDHYADDLAAVVEHLDLKGAVHVGHSTGGGEVVHYLARHGESRATKAALLSAVPPLMVKTPANPDGLPKDVFDGFQAQLAANRAQFYRDVPAGPFYGFNRPGVTAQEGLIQNWWRQGMMGGCQSALRRHRRLLADRLHRGPEKDHDPGAGDAQRRRPDRALRRFRSPIGQASQERHAEDLQWLPARHADHARRYDQRRPAGVHQGLMEARGAARLRRRFLRRDAL
jgi:non-heme chloroperoxidase